MEKRSEYLEKARKADFLDAVFYITYYNRYIKPIKKPIDIEPQEIFDDVNEDEYQVAFQRSEKLLDASAYVGMAFHKYSGSEPYEDAFKRMKTENPGFDERCYDIAASQSILSMR